MTAPACSFPIRLRSGSVAELLGEPALEQSLARLLGLAFASARQLAAGESPQGSIALMPPRMLTSGLEPDAEAAVLAIVERAIAAAAAAQSLPLERRSPRATPRPAKEGQPRIRPDVSEPFDPQRFDPKAGTYEVPAYDHGKRKLPARRSGDPFRGVLARLEPLIDAMIEVLKQLESARVSATGRTLVVERLKLAYQDILQERQATRYLQQVTQGRISRADVPLLYRQSFDRLVDHYHPPGSKLRVQQVAAVREAQLERGLRLLQAVRARVGNLDAEAAKQPVPDEAGYKDALTTVGTYYLELLIVRPQPEAFQRLVFLDTFYANHGRIRAYAIVAEAKRRLPELFKGVFGVTNFVIGYRGGPVVTGGLKGAPIMTHRYVTPDSQAAYDTVNLARYLWRAIEPIAETLPRVPAQAGTAPTERMANDVAAYLVRLQIRLALMSIWNYVDELRGVLDTYRTVRASIRDRYNRELDALEADLAAEASRWPQSKDIADRVSRWEARLAKLAEDIGADVRFAEIRAAVIRALPMLVVGQVAAASVGVWVATVSNGSRLLIALAEAATITAINVLSTVPSASRPVTAVGVVKEFLINLAWARFGRMVIDFKPAIPLLANRRALLTASKLVVIGVGIPTLQTAIQALEDKEHKQGGASAFTDLLTINLILSGFSLLVGLGLHTTEGTGPPGGLLKMTPSEIAEFVNQGGVEVLSERAAADWKALEARTQDFQKRFQDVVRASREGRLSEQEFGEWRKEGLDLVAELRQKLPGLAEILETGQSRAEIEVALDGVAARLNDLRWSPGGGAVLALPEFTPGLEAAGGTTFTFDPERPPAPARLAALKKTFQGRNLTIRDLEGGGWEAVDPADGRSVVQLLPAGPAVKGLLPPSLEMVGSGDYFRDGLEMVRRQTAVPQLESLLAMASAGEGAGGVLRLLRLLGRFVKAGDQRSLRGLANYLERGGNPNALARALTRAESRKLPQEAQKLLDIVLGKIGDWDAEATRGLAALYELRPRMRSEDMEALFGDNDPEMVKGIFQTIATLRGRSAGGLGRVIGELTAEGTEKSPFMKQHGAMGVLTAAGRLAEEFLTARLRFEVPVYGEGDVVLRRQDIVVIEPETVQVGGKQVTREKVILVVEVKEVQGGVGSKRTRRQLAFDMALDWKKRAGQSQAASGRPFEGMRWMIRKFEYEEAARENLQAAGNPVPTSQEVTAEMRRIVAGELRPVFNEPILKQVPGTELQTYRNAFDAPGAEVPFVVFY